jgi:NitT/TauT family transport system ATP-binding protein
MSLVLDHVSKRFDNTSHDTLHNITFTIEDGEFICVIGPSGCGKTTLLNIIAGLEAPTSGTVTLDGVTITCAGPDRAVMFQEPALFPWLSVLDNVKFGLRVAGKNNVEQKEIALRYLKMVQLAHFVDYRPHQLSGGMKQRAALARALALDSKVLLMDEPFSALDKQTRNKLREEVHDVWLRTRKRVLFVTHSVEEAVFFADRIIMLSANPGTIIKEFNVTLPRPRHIEEPAFIGIRADLLNQIRVEVSKSVEQEYKND